MKKTIFIFLLGLLFIFKIKAQAPFYLNKYYLKSEINIKSLVYAEVDYTNPIEVWEKEFGVSKTLSTIVDFSLPKELHCDVYSPDDSYKRPAVILIHGGAFISELGNKNDASIVKLAYEFAQRGYVAISIEYRTMNLLTPSFIKAGYTALQDTRAAVKYVANHSKELNIDPSQIFVGGISAGAVTSLNFGFVEQGENIAGREKKLDEMFGCIDCVGEFEKTPYEIKGIFSLSGALFDLNVMDNNDTPVILFHGKKDRMVPYNHGIPFEKISSKYNAFIDKCISLAKGYPLLIRELKEGKVLDVYGSENIHNHYSALSKSSKHIQVKDGDHYLLYSGNNVLTSQGLKIVHDISTFMYNNLKAN